MHLFTFMRYVYLKKLMLNLLYNYMFAIFNHLPIDRSVNRRNIHGQFGNIYSLSTLWKHGEVGTKKLKLNLPVHSRKVSRLGIWKV